MKEMWATAGPSSVHENGHCVNKKPGTKDLNLIAPSKFKFHMLCKSVHVYISLYGFVHKSSQN